MGTDGGGRGPVAPPVFKTGLAANTVAGGFDSLPPPYFKRSGAPSRNLPWSGEAPHLRRWSVFIHQWQWFISSNRVNHVAQLRPRLAHENRLAKVGRLLSPVPYQRMLLKSEQASLPGLSRQ